MHEKGAEICVLHVCRQEPWMKMNAVLSLTHAETAFSSCIIFLYVLHVLLMSSRFFCKCSYATLGFPQAASNNLSRQTINTCLKQDWWVSGCNALEIKAVFYIYGYLLICASVNRLNWCVRMNVCTMRAGIIPSTWKHLDYGFSQKMCRNKILFIIISTKRGRILYFHI